MFSGIIEELGEVKKISKRDKIAILDIVAKKVLEDIDIGDSISINGVCLTITNKQRQILSFDVMPETLNSTTLRYLRVFDKVNLERSIKMGDRLSGHFVTGHIDCTGFIRKKNYIHDSMCVEVSIPIKFMEFISPKGSIAIDGISLTVGEKKSNTFTVYIIPHTFKNTTLGFKGPSTQVNIELDILAKLNRK